MKKSSKVVKSIIGVKSKIEGNISAEESVSIEGSVLGTVRVEGTLVVAKTAVITGDIFADDLIVSGVVEGNITAKNKVEAFEKAEIYGNITAKSLLVDEKVIFQGNCNINQELVVKAKGGKGTSKREENVSEKVSELVDKL